MKRWFQRFAVFLLIAGLIVGGLAWATIEALQMESNRRTEAAQGNLGKNPQGNVAVGWLHFPTNGS